MADGNCNLCGEFGRLTDEHVPPRSAFNDRLVLHFSYRPTPFGILPQAHAMPRGNFKPVLCGRCNNNTGGAYGTEYAKFIQKVAERADQASVGDVVEFDIRTFPLRVVKQALMIIVASSSSALTNENSELRRFLLHQETRGMPGGLRLYSFIPATRVSKSTGRGTMVDLRSRKTARFAENSWWPIGWVLAFDDAPLTEAFEVTHWANSRFRPSEITTARLPVLWTSGMGPADFRSPDQLRRERTDVVFGNFE